MIFLLCMLSDNLDLYKQLRYKGSAFLVIECACCGFSILHVQSLIFTLTVVATVPCLIIRKFCESLEKVVSSFLRLPNPPIRPYQSFTRLVPRFLSEISKGTFSAETVGQIPLIITSTSP